MSKEKSSIAWFWFGRWVCRIFCLLFFRVRYYRLENIPANGAFILVCNHQSFLDPLFCGIALKRQLSFVARDTLFTKPVLGWMIAAVGTIPVRRGEADLSAMRKIINKLKEGRGVCLFPEGTRSKDGRITAFKPGFGLLCRRGGAAVVPAVVDGAFECWPRHKKIFSPGAKIAVCYGECITAEQVKDMSEKELADNLTETLRRMQNEVRVKQGKEPYSY